MRSANVPFRLNFMGSMRPVIPRPLVSEASPRPVLRFADLALKPLINVCDALLRFCFLQSFPHVCRTELDPATGFLKEPDHLRIAVTIHAAWRISKTTASTMIPKSQADASVAAFEREGAPTRLNLARQTVQPKYERRIGYRRCTKASSEGRPCFESEYVEDDSLCVIGDDVGSPVCDTNYYGFMIDRLSADKQLFHARYMSGATN